MSPFMLPIAPLDMEVEVGLLKRGRLVWSKKQKAHSPVRNWVKVVKAFFERGEETIKDVNGTEQTFKAYAQIIDNYCNGGYVDLYFELKADAPDNDDSYGILAGKGTYAVTPDDFNLVDKYRQGSGEGYLDYNATEFPPIEEGEVTINDKKYKYMKLTISRPVLNNANVDQTIYEVGLVLWHWFKVEGGDKATEVSFKFLAFRDVLDTPLTIPAGETGVLRYHFRWLIPA